MAETLAPAFPPIAGDSGLAKLRRDDLEKRRVLLPLILHPLVLGSPNRDEFGRLVLVILNSGRRGPSLIPAASDLGVLPRPFHELRECESEVEIDNTEGQCWIIDGRIKQNL